MAKKNRPLSHLSPLQLPASPPRPPHMLNSILPLFLAPNQDPETGPKKACSGAPSCMINQLRCKFIYSLRAVNPHPNCPRSRALPWALSNRSFTTRTGAAWKVSPSPCLQLDSMLFSHLNRHRLVADRTSPKLQHHRSLSGGSGSVFLTGVGNSSASSGSLAPIASASARQDSSLPSVNRPSAPI